MKHAFERLRAALLIRRVIKGKEPAIAMKKLLTELAMSAVRHGLTALGAMGVVVSDETQVQIAGVVSFLVGVVLIVVDKLVVAKLK